MEITTILWGLAIAISIAALVVILSIGCAFGDKADIYEDDEGNLHFRRNGSLWDDSPRTERFGKIDWSDVQGD